MLIVGLGNPGDRYSETRHNAGFWFVERLAEREGLRFRSEAKFSGELCRWSSAAESWILKPTTFMNRSGQAVGALARFYKVPADEILIVHDELDLPAGSARLKLGGGHGGHNGLRDIINHLSTREFRRLRLGIDHPGHRDQVVNYVLDQPSKADRKAIDEAIDEALAVLPDVIAGRHDQAMNRLHGTK